MTNSAHQQLRNVGQNAPTMMRQYLRFDSKFVFTDKRTFYQYFCNFIEKQLFGIPTISKRPGPLDYQFFLCFFGLDPRVIYSFYCLSRLDPWILHFSSFREAGFYFVSLGWTIGSMTFPLFLQDGSLEFQYFRLDPWIINSIVSLGWTFGLLTFPCFSRLDPWIMTFLVVAPSWVLGFRVFPVVSRAGRDPCIIIFLCCSRLDLWINAFFLVSSGTALGLSYFFNVSRGLALLFFFFRPRWAPKII